LSRKGEGNERKRFLPLRGGRSFFRRDDVFERWKKRGGLGDLFSHGGKDSYNIESYEKLFLRGNSAPAVKREKKLWRCPSFF